MSHEPTELDLALIRSIAELSTEGGRPFVKLNKVVLKSARQLGTWNDQMEEWLWDECLDWPAEPERFYERCVLSIRAGVYVEGQGNYGGHEWRAGTESSDCDGAGASPAHPLVLECRLTTLGLDLLGSLGR